MIPAIVIGRKGSQGFPGKNTASVLGKPMASYPISAAINSKEVDRVCVSTDDEQIMQIASGLGAELIKRPAELATNSALGEDVFVHAYEQVKKISSESIEMVALMFCNSPTISPAIIDSCVAQLRANPEADSIVTVSRYNMWSPLRARKLNNEGYLEPFVPFEVFGDPMSLNCDRDSQGDVLFADMSLSVVRTHCLEDMNNGLLPQKWMGQKILSFRQDAGCDVDYEWQLPMVEWWIKKNN